MKSVPQISIIIPVYNSKNYLERCVLSILNQQEKGFELILVDDGSTDGSSSLCDELSEKDKRIIVCHQENAGANAARKNGVSRAKGKWLMFVDSDDTLTEYGLHLLMNYSQYDYDIIAGAVNKGGRLFGHKVSGELNKEEYIGALLTVQTTDGPVAKLFRKDLFDNFEWHTPRNITLNEDMLMLIGLSTNVNKAFVTSDIVCYNYYLHGDSASLGTMKYAYWVDLFEIIEAYIKPYLETNKEILKSFCIYRLKRIYNNVVTHGEFPSRKDEYLRKLVADCSCFNDDLFIINTSKALCSKRAMRKQYLMNKPSFIRLKALYTLVKKHL